MKKRCIKRMLVFLLIGLLIGSGSLPIINGNKIEKEIQTLCPMDKDSFLDMDYIYSLTENLSYIIFNEYNESTGEIAKGRAFGSKGEHKAAQILFENFTELGLDTKKVQIKNIYHKNNWRTVDLIMHPLWELTNGYQALEYKLILTNISSGQKENIKCEITPISSSKNKIHEEIKIFNYTDLKIIEKPNSIRDWKDYFSYDKKGEDYVFIGELLNSSIKSRDPNVTLSFYKKFMRDLIYPIRSILGRREKKVNKLREILFYNTLNHWNGTILYDYTKDTHHTGSNSGGANKPCIYINRTIGKKIIQDIKNYTVDIYIKQQYNNSIIGYNVIGEIKGTSPKNETVILCCLYDSGQCQGTGDSAIGMSIVMAIAKYFVENDIEPYYNLKFIGFCGEEAGNRGARYYEATHRKEEIVCVIDVNQVGLLQKKPKLTLNVIGNRLWFINDIWEVVKRSDYEKRVNYSTFIAKRYWREGVMSDQYVFNYRCPTVCFLEDFPWVMHHKDSLDHKKGDCMDQFEWIDVSITSEIILNVTQYLACKSDEKILLNNQFNEFFPKTTFSTRILRRL